MKRESNSRILLHTERVILLIKYIKIRPHTLTHINLKIILDHQIDLYIYVYSLKCDDNATKSFEVLAILSVHIII